MGKSALEPRENACTQGPGAHVSARVQGLDLVLRHPSVPGFQRGYLKKTCVHISAQQVLYSGTSARVPSVNAPLGASKLGPSRKLTAEDVLLLVLTRLHVGMLEQDLAVRFKL